jgi:hypothetical protein
VDYVKTNEPGSLLDLSRITYQNMESKAVEEVVKRDRHDKIKDDEHNRELFEKHLTNMRSILNNYDYELSNMHQIVSNCKKMKGNEAESYVKMLEALALGYRKKFGSALIVPFLTGVVAKAKDPYEMSKYYDVLVSEIVGKIDLANAKGRIEERKIDELMLELRYKESGIMRIFRKGEINRIKSRIIKKKKRVEKYYAKADNYRMLFSTIKSIVSKK